MKTTVVPLLLCFAITLPAQTFTTLASFSENNGAYPEAALLQGTDGNLYGAALTGGNLPCYAGYGCGTIFKVTPEGKIVTVYTFCSQPNCSDGAEPYAGLIQDTDGNLYGTTYAGGNLLVPSTAETWLDGCGDSVIPGCGTVFKITPRGMLTTLYSFCRKPDCNDGKEPFSALAQAANGTLYGTTSYGPGALPDEGYGTVFEITADGEFNSLQSFAFNDGVNPASREAMVEAPDGDFYGTTTGGGAYGNQREALGGTVFRFGPEGTLTAIYSFCAQPNCLDGNDPLSGVIQGSNGNFYGTTFNYGANGYGTLFEVTPQGELTTLHNFCSEPDCRDGAYAYGRVIQATDGNIYGTTYSSGAAGGGTIYEISPEEEGLTVLYNFCTKINCIDGGHPFAGLLQATNGKFYGTTCCGGANGLGVVFSLDMGLSPFITFVQPFGKVGQTGGILGQGFTGTTSVVLNGVPASFTVVSDTYIKATVPQGATTGYVSVTTPTGVLTSNVPFHVIR